jgi:hypothetical protein
MEWIMALVGGLGIGSLLTTIVNHVLTRKSGKAERLYQEKREAYLGMTRALYDVEIEPGPKNVKMFGLYLNIAKIFGSNDVVVSAQKVIDSKPHSPARDLALNAFYEAMKTDLKKNS